MLEFDDGEVKPVEATAAGHMVAPMVSAIAANPAVDLFYPMNEFYERAGMVVPPIVRVDGHDVPSPYHSLLVHGRDMTSTLTAAYQRKLKLGVLNRVLTDSVLAREIVLEIEDGGKRVVYAAIKIYLDLFPPEARRLILECKQPFGAILHGQDIVYSSRPQAFFQVVADRAIKHSLRLKGQYLLYGRRNALLNSAQKPLAQVLEIVPPSE